MLFDDYGDPNYCTVVLEMNRVKISLFIAGFGWQHGYSVHVGIPHSIAAEPLCPAGEQFLFIHSGWTFLLPCRLWGTPWDGRGTLPPSPHTPVLFRWLEFLLCESDTCTVRERHVHGMCMVKIRSVNVFAVGPRLMLA